MSYIHQAGIIHRDIKLANVILTPTGDVKVIGFGIARAVADTMTEAGEVIGTAQYLSHEAPGLPQNDVADRTRDRPEPSC